MKILSAIVLLIGISSSAWSQPETSRQTNYNLKKGLAIEGYDPVSYFDDKPSEGRPEFKTTFKGVTYLFSSAAHLETFRKAPEKYEPAYGGWCAYAMGESGDKVKVDPETFTLLDGKLYLFYNFWGNNTLNAWKKNEASLKMRGDQNWKEFVP